MSVRAKALAVLLLLAAAIGAAMVRPALRRARRLALLPGLFDLAETSLVLSALAGYPESLPAKIGWLCLLTPAKWLAAAALAASALAGAALRVGRPSPPLPEPHGRNS